MSCRYRHGDPLRDSIAIPPAVEYEYRITSGPRKAWDGLPDLSLEGWEMDPVQGRPGEGWDRFDYHEERYWRRPKNP